MDIHYKNDFDFILELRDSRGRLMGWPDWDWSLVLRTESCRRRFSAYRCGSALKACYKDGEQIHIVVSNSGLGLGKLRMEFTAELPAESYGDERQTVSVKTTLAVRLVAGDGDTVKTFKAGIRLPTSFRPKTAAGVCPNVNGGVYRLQRGIISIFARAGYAYRNHGMIKLPIDKGIRTKTYSTAHIDSGLIREEQPQGKSMSVEYDPIAQTATMSIAPQADINSLEKRLLIDEKAGRYVMRCSDGVIRAFDEFAPVDASPRLPTPDIGAMVVDGSLYDVLDNPGKGYQLQHKQNRHARKNSVNLNYPEKNKWRNVVRARGFGVYRIRRRSRHHKSAWAVFSIMTKHGIRDVDVLT